LFLERARTIDGLVAQHHKDRMETRKLMAGAALAESLGGLDARDPNFGLKSAKLFSAYAEGADSPAAKAVATMKNAEFTAIQTAQANGRQAAYTATLQKRIGPLMASDAVRFGIKNQLINSDGTFNADAVERAEALHLASGGKAGAEFYDNLQKEHGLTRADLDSAIADPGSDQHTGAVKYIGTTGPVSAKDAVGKEGELRAVGSLPNGTLPTGAVLNLPLEKFNEAVTTHKNLSRQPGMSPDDLAAQAQVFRDRLTMEKTLQTEGLTPASAAPAGYDAWRAAQRTAPAPAAPSAPVPAATPAPAPTLAPIDFLRRALGITPAATPAASPVAAVSGLPDATDENLDATA
jgi:hypothetical protein